MAFDAELHRQFYNTLKVERKIDFSIESERQKYVKNMHGDYDAVQLLKKEINLCEGQGVFLFSGQSGTGKTTEMLRLAHELQLQLGNNGRVFYTDMAEWLNPTQPVELSSFMLGVVAAWVNSVEVSDGGAGQRSAWDKLWDFLRKTDIALESLGFSVTGQSVQADASAIEVQTDIAGLSGNIKLALQNDSEFRQLLETALKKNKTSYVNQLHQFVRDLKEQLCPGTQKCILLIDSLEKITGGGENTEEVLSSVLQLFEQQGTVLQLPLVHVVYSIPPFILRQNRQLPSRLGNAVDVSLPSVHVFNRKSTQVDTSEYGGQHNLLALLAQRFPRWDAYFTKEQVFDIIKQTGGYIRDYLRVLQLCLLNLDESQPRVTDIHIKRAFDRIRPNLDIPEQDKQWLKQVAETHESCLSKDKEKGMDVYDLEAYIKTNHVLAYMNGETWYGVHPLIRDRLLKA